MSLVRDIIKVSVANILSLLAAVITGFIVPAFLSIEQYAYLKTYTLILSFAGILHFGFIDGIYLKYGGKYFKDLDLRILKLEKTFFILFQFLFAIIIMVIGIIINEPLIIAVAAAILPYNLLSFYQLFYQAIGQFNIYTKIRLTLPFIILVFNIFLIYLLKTQNYIYYISAEIAAYSILVIYIEYSQYSKIKKLTIASNIMLLSENFRIGFMILLGNLSLILFTMLGRWIVKLWMTDADFAYYSFASSIMQILTLVISSIAMTFYPYLSRVYQERDITQLKIQLILISTFLSSCYFVFNFAVIQFIPKYETSLKILAILFISLPAYTVVNALYINLYKIRKDGRRYIMVILINLIVACILSGAAYLIRKDIISISVATVLSYYFWMYYSSRDFEGLKPTIKEIFFITAYLVIYILGVLFSSPFLGIGFFLAFYSLLSLIYKHEITQLISKLRLLVAK